MSVKHILGLLKVRLSEHTLTLRIFLFISGASSSEGSVTLPVHESEIENEVEVDDSHTNTFSFLDSPKRVYLLQKFTLTTALILSQSTNEIT